METNATPSPIEPKRYGTPEQQRAYMADVLGMPRPTTAHVGQPRAFTNTEPSKASGTGHNYAHRSHRHYGTKGEK
jgi:hypothetical protein